MRSRWDRPRLRRAAASILLSGLRAADPDRLVRANLARTKGGVRIAGADYNLHGGRLVVVAAGKAASRMAAAAERALGARIDAGLAVDTAPGPHLQRSALLLAGHPLPDARGVRAADEVEALARGLGPRDVLLVLLSGGASALLPAPVAGVTLAAKAELTRQLLRAGASIGEINTVRKHLSRLKGGGLALAAGRARVACLVLSDVVGDDLSTIASGPTVPDSTTYADALEVLRGRGLLSRVPAAVRAHLEAGARGDRPETLKPHDARLRAVATQIVGSNRLSVDAAAREAVRLGLRAVVLTTRLEGEAREAARVLVSVLRECVESGRPEAPPVCLLAGGETTVTVLGQGQGGRNQEMALAAALPLASFPVPAVFAALATDGIDGVGGAAGGVADDRSLARAAQLGLAPASAFLEANDSRAFLGPLADLLVTGPTGTNVVDLTALLAGTRR